MRNGTRMVWSGVLGFTMLVSGAASVSATHKMQKMSADPGAAMAKAQKWGTPGEQHKVLNPLVGKWKHTIRHWMKPGAAPMESKGTNVNAWVLGGRFLEQRTHGTFNGQHYEDIGYVGYDNVRGEYQTVWMSSMMTGVVEASGTYDPTTETVKQSGQFGCPMTGNKNQWFRSEMKIVDKDHYTYTSYSKAPDGSEFKGMEIEYTRAS